MLRLSPNPISHEDLFIERYEQLFRWSLKLAGTDRQTAEDILHDTFVQFTLSRPDLSAIRNVDAYLYTAVRNRYLSHVRRANRSPIGRLSTLDYDSAELSLRSSDPRTLLQVRQDLWMLCQYARTRSKTSKSGSILLLRFFHSFYPAEIAQIMIGTPQAVNFWISTARAEARRYLESPNGFNWEVDRISQPSVDGDILAELRLETFRHPSGDCVPPETFRELYRKAAGLDAKVLAHIASCETCLSFVCGLLKLSPPSERYPTDTLGPMPPSGTQGGSAGQRLKTSRHRRREVLDQHPAKLFVAVNGFFIGALAVSSPRSELNLSVNVEEKIGFVEVFSEQGVLLLSLDVEPPPEGPVEHFSRVDLSEARSLELSLGFLANWPSLVVEYSDPVIEGPVVRTDSGETKDVTGASPSAAREAAPKSAARGRLGLALRRTWDFATRPLRQQLLTRIGPTEKGEGRPISIFRPGVVTAVGILIVVLVLILARTWTPSVSASELLSRSVASQAAILQQSGATRHRTISVEELSDSGTPSRKRIEVWERAGSTGNAVRAVRLYEGENRLVAEELTDADNSSRLFIVGEQAEQQSDAAGVSLAPNRIWRLALSADKFTSLVGDAGDALVEGTSDFYTIRYAPRDSVNGSILKTAALTLSRPDLRAIKLSIVVDRDHTEVEYRFTETFYEQVQPGAAPAAIFEHQNAAAFGSGNKEYSDRASRDTQGVAPGAPPASAELEIEVAYLLDRAQANRGEQVSLIRTTQGTLLVEGIVETSRRKREILDALAPVSSERSLRIEIMTLAEAVKRRGSASSDATGTVLELSRSSTFPVYADLRSSLVRRGVSPDMIEEEIRSVSIRLLAGSRAALSHAWALKRISDQFRLGDGGTLSPEARAKRLNMLHSHAASLGEQEDRLRSELAKIFGEVRPSVDADRQPIDGTSDVVNAINRLTELTSACDRIIQSAFTVSGSQTAAAEIRSPRFFRELAEIETLSSQLARFQD